MGRAARHLVWISLLLAPTAHAQTLFISEYHEGMTTTNKYIEIFNPTQLTANLNVYGMGIVFNAPTTAGNHEVWYTFPYGSTLAPGATFTLCNPGIDSRYVLACDDTSSTFANFNGDDGICLASGTESSHSVIDCVGDWQGDPGSGWRVCGIAQATRNMGLVRRPTVTSGQAVWGTSAGTNLDDCEWTFVEGDNMNEIGGHVCMSCTGAAAAGDPHLNLANGGSADFRGIDRTYFAFLSAPNLHVNAMTEDRSFYRWGGQLVHGSFVTRLAFTIRSAKTGAVVRASVRANQYASFRQYRAEEDGDECYYSNHTRIELGDVELLQLSGGRFVAHGAGWEIFVNRRRLRKPLAASRAADDAARWFLDFSFNVLDGRPGDVEKFGRSTLGRIAPHGLVGQSFDGSKTSLSGKLDSYGGAREVWTSAQAEGAIEGVHTDYAMRSAFATSYRFGRFDAIEPIAPRNISTLSGVKAAAREGAGSSAGVTDEE